MKYRLTSEEVLCRQHNSTVVTVELHPTMSICPSARMEQLASHWTDIHEICYLIVFLKYVDEMQLSLKSDKNNGCFTPRHE